MATKIYSENKDFFVEDIKKFTEKYQLIVASGGLVRNSAEEILFIFRRGKWDMPKGKVDEGESLETCADREIKEETGLKELVLQKPLITTHHIYTEKGKDILKETHWFAFLAPGKQELHPQKEEDIEEAEWADVSNLSKYLANTYPLIKDVLNAAGL
jgi:8-oxo-dGTP pyrophosphatase MutT (NUDIX family)